MRGPANVVPRIPAPGFPGSRSPDGERVQVVPDLHSCKVIEGLAEPVWFDPFARAGTPAFDGLADGFESRLMPRAGESGALVRTHGGAIRRLNPSSDYPLNLREAVHRAEKVRIDNLHRLITDSKADPQMVAQLRSRNLEVILV